VATRLAPVPAPPLVLSEVEQRDPAPREPPPQVRLARVPAGAWLAAVLVLAALVRVWQIDAVGYNSDEAVYGGQAASIAHDPQLDPFFPTFRAHPLLFQTLVSVGYHLGAGEIFGRLASAALGVATVLVVFRLGELLYGRRAGLVAALLLALMPYHVVVTRQVLLDGPMVLFATLALLFVARFALTRNPAWLYAAGAASGVSMLSKETSVVLLGSVYAFLALTPALRVRVRHLAGSLGLMAVVASAYPISLALAGRTSTGGNYLAWQLFRRPNHGWVFYPEVVSPAVGLLVLAAAGFGLWALRRHGSWRETLLLAWIAVPVAFFELWPVKGFQYLLPVAPAVAVLAARALTRCPRGARARAAAIAVVAASLAFGTLQRIEPSATVSLLAGSGGVPGGRETGEWIRDHVPPGAQLLTIGPSMANLVQYYGHRRAYGLSVSSNPLNRNPSYQPVANPDRMIRDDELQYLVWDGYSAGRSRFFSARLLRYADRYHGRLIHRTGVIDVYEVRP